MAFKKNHEDEETEAQSVSNLFKVTKLIKLVKVQLNTIRNAPGILVYPFIKAVQLY